jgi:hypothetical protein
MWKNRKTEENATAVKLKQLLPKCNACTVAMNLHQFAIIGTTVVGEQDKPRVAQFFGRIKRHEWNDLIQFKDWQSDRDNLVAYLIACPGGGGMVVAVRSPFELYDRDEVLLLVTLTPEEQSVLSQLVPAEDWQRL